MLFGTRALLPLLVGLATASQHDDDACGQLHQKYLKQGNSSAGFSAPGDLALRCLQSMPFDSDRAESFAKEYRKYLQFQSTLETLKDPPDGYPMPSVDLLGGLDKIQQKAAKDKYKSQYEFDTELDKLISSAYDGHLSLGLCSQYFKFKNDAPLVSISSDGLELPKIYTAHDALLLSSDSNSVSAVKSINGEDAVEHLTNVSSLETYQDWDALFNSVFFSNALSITQTGQSNKFLGYFSETTRWPGASQTLSFANGSTAVFNTTAHSKKGFTWENSKDFYKGVCLSKANASTTSSSSTGPAKPLDVPSGYPKPFNRDKYNYILGFFPDSDTLQDVAVLRVPSFAVQSPRNGTKPPSSKPLRFSNIARDLLLNATEKGKKKMIVDLSGNGGGTVQAGVNLFRLFFPDEVPYTAARFRIHDAVNLLAQYTSQTVSLVLDKLGLEEQVVNPFYWQTYVQPDQETGFSSWSNISSPEKILGVNSSSLVATNFTRSSNSTNPLSGYGPVPLNPSKRAFAPEDIIMITDGTCGSTCTIFAELMKDQGVRTIAFGGRPQHAPMQGLGGVKGSELFDFPSFATQIEGSEQVLSLFKEDFQDRWNSTMPLPMQEFPLKLSSGGVNFKNSYSRHDDQTPLQFVYEAAECRRFYTAENIVDVESIWAAAAEAMFYGGECVSSSMNGTGSLWPEKGTGGNGDDDSDDDSGDDNSAGSAMSVSYLMLFGMGLVSLLPWS